MYAAILAYSSLFVLYSLVGLVCFNTSMPRHRKLNTGAECRLTAVKVRFYEQLDRRAILFTLWVLTLAGK
jgi:hypothetical protein